MSWFAIVVGLLIVAIVLVLAWRAGYLDSLVAAIDRFRAGQVDNALRRMWPLWLLFAACFGVVLFLNPMKAGLALYGIGKIALAGPVGYLISYCCTARAERPENLADGIALGTAQKCRAWIICAAILGMAIGVP